MKKNKIISKNTIRQVIENSNILDILDLYSTDSRRVGNNYMYSCIFHEEKTPSLSVDVEEGIYYCFGCGEAGNIITLLQEKQNLSFVDSVKFLADKAGIIIDYDFDNSEEIFEEFRKKVTVDHNINKVSEREYLCYHINNKTINNSLIKDSSFFQDETHQRIYNYIKSGERMNKEANTLHEIMEGLDTDGIDIEMVEKNMISRKAKKIKE